jgi:2-haloacid dehalogenase
VHPADPPIRAVPQRAADDCQVARRGPFRVGATAKRDLLAAHDELDAFPDVGPGLERLRAAGHELVVFSNGTADMIERVVAAAGIGEYFQGLVSVDEVRSYKPSPRVYRHAAERLGRSIGAVWLVSSNPFDAIGAATAGMRTAWVDRAAGPFDPLGPEPEIAVRDLSGLAEALEQS